MVLFKLGAPSTCLGLRYLAHDLKMQGAGVGVGVGWSSGRTAAAASTSGTSVLPILPLGASNTAIRGHPYTTTCPSPTTSLQMATSRPGSTVAAETTYVNDRRIVHISTRYAQLRSEQQQRSGSSELPPTISDIIARQAAVSVRRAAELVRFGAVYIGEETVNGGGKTRTPGKGKTKRHPGGEGEEPVSVVKGTAISEAQRRKINSKSAGEPPFVGTSFAHMRLRRLDGSEALSPPPPNAYLRVHCDPRTFPAARATDWRERLVAVTEDYLVVDKPPGVPSVPTIDNAVENALHQAGLALAFASIFDRSNSGGVGGTDNDSPPSLHAVSRLDVCTSGLIIFARNAPSAATLNRLFRERGISKRYLALLAPGPAVRLGLTTHCCRSRAFDGRSRPRLYANYDTELLEGGKWGGAWIEARSTILLCAPVTGRAVVEAVEGDRAEAEAATEISGARVVAASLEAELAVGLEAARARSGDGAAAGGVPAPYGRNALGMTDSGVALDAEGAMMTAAREQQRYHPPHLCVMELGTGRTHQLRLQLAAMGAAIIGDTRYRGVVGRVHRGVPADDRMDIFGPEPDSIALQAARLEFEWEGERIVYSAKRPPWASENSAQYLEHSENYN